MIEIFLVFAVFGLLGFVMVMVNKILGPKKPSPIKESPFECGSPYLQDTIHPVPVKFYLVAFLFLLFDVEVVFFFPWALVFKQLGSTALIVMFAYVLILIVGFVYAWQKGAFQWEE
jgi:NADH-quinone oxidoreductase subunit A